jgi:arylsulfatase A
VPGIIRWPGKVKAGTIEQTPAGLVDILPTLTEITGTLIPKDRTIDGTSLTPLFNNKKIARKKPLFWYYNPSRPVCVIREGDWNLIADPVIDIPKDNVFKEEWIGMIKESALTNFRLFNLKTDISQKNDVSSQHPELFEALKKKMISLHKEVVTEARDWRTFSWK